MNRLASLTVASLLALGLVACQSETAQTTEAKVLASDSPADAVERIASELKSDNLLGAMQAAVPPADFDALKAKYEEGRKEQPSASDAAEFAENMAKLTESDAEAKLMAELEPLLVKYETEMQAQLPMLLAMGRGYGQQWVQEEKTLSEDQKKQTIQMIDAIANWVQSVNFADRDKARQAISKVVATARKLDIKTLEAAQALSFEDAMAKASIGSAGLKDVLAVYGLNINAMLASVDSKVVSEEGDVARVSVSYTMFDQPLTADADMVRRDGRWYGKDSLEKLDRERNSPAEVAGGEDMDDASDDFQDSDDMEEAGSDSASDTSGQ